jgi:hypothetical protein
VTPRRATSTLQAERRLGRIAGLAALASVASWLGALAFTNATGAGPAINLGATVGHPTPLNRARELLAFHAGLSDQAVATALRCMGLMLTAMVGLYLYSLVRTRGGEGSGRWMPASALAGAILVAGATVFGYFALRHVAGAFVSSGPYTTARAQHLVDASVALHAAAVFDLASRLVLAFWIGVASLQMMRVGLLDHFLAYWGFGACAALALLPIGDAMFIGWLGSLGVIALGYWPGGRPEAWRKVPIAP